MSGDDRIPIEHAMSAMLAQLIRLRDAHPGADTVPVPRAALDTLLDIGWRLVCSADARRRELQRLTDEDEQAFDTLREPGSRRERLERFGRALGAVKADGTLYGDRAGRDRAAVIARYLWLLRVERHSRGDAADTLCEEFGYPSRKAARSALERWALDIESDPDAPEWRLPAILLDDTGEASPWPRRPAIPIPPEWKSRK